MGKFIMAMLGATAGVAAAVFIAARRESKQVSGAASLSTTMPEASPLPEVPAAPSESAWRSGENATQEGATSG